MAIWFCPLANDLTFFCLCGLLQGMQSLKPCRFLWPFVCVSKGIWIAALPFQRWDGLFRHIQYIHGHCDHILRTRQQQEQKWSKRIQFLIQPQSDNTRIVAFLAEPHGSLVICCLPAAACPMNIGWPQPFKPRCFLGALGWGVGGPLAGVWWGGVGG